MRWNALCGSRNLSFGGECGQALIETAISSILLVGILLGGVQLGMMAYAAIEVANSAKAAVQYGAMNGGAWTRSGLDQRGMLAAAQADAGNLVSDISFVTAPTYTCTCTGAGVPNCGNSPPTGCTGSHLLITVRVNTQATYRPLFRFPGSDSWGITLRGSAQEDVLQ